MQLQRNPTLESVLMVEKAIREHGGEGPYQIWKKLPRKMSYQAFQTIVEYLEYSNKIARDEEGKIAWIYNPVLFEKYAKRRDLEWLG
ncbi:MAG TPA: hypothetical protein VJI67_01520 [archaeon]|nr:hypothetical protein [archaeon]